ncbi:MAG: hypothetical protein M3070_00675 [Actinomycetota bacterium]|nr:hypothetical protein [Actinomycetota bacterium]
MASIEKRTRDGQLRWYVRYPDPSSPDFLKPSDADAGRAAFAKIMREIVLDGCTAERSD